MYTSPGGYTANARIENAFYLRAITPTGTFTIRHPAGAYGEWTLDLAYVSTTQFELIDRKHPAVTVVSEFVATAGGSGGLHFYASAFVNFDITLITQVEDSAVPSCIASAGTAASRVSDILTIPRPLADDDQGTVLLNYDVPKKGLSNASYNVRLLAMGGDRGFVLEAASTKLGVWDGATSFTASGTEGAVTVGAHTASFRWNQVTGAQLGVDTSSFVSTASLFNFGGLTPWSVGANASLTTGGQTLKWLSVFNDYLTDKQTSVLQQKGDL